MYSDNTLTAKEAIRLCALGTLAQGPLPYGALAQEVRSFVSHVAGPLLELMGSSIELLKYEALVKVVDGEGIEADSRLAITEAGRRGLRELLTANLRGGTSELNKLIIALKFRFLHLLEANEQRAQAELLIEACDNELARLEALRSTHAKDGGFFVEWLDHDIGLLEQRLEWLTAFRRRLVGQA